MNKKILSPKAPAAIGPYSHAILAGDTIYISGQLPLNPATGEFSGDDVKSQTKQCLLNLEAILTEADMSFSDVVKTTVLLEDISSFADMNEVYGEFLGDAAPARAAYAVKDLPKGALVEIEAIAVKQ